MPGKKRWASALRDLRHILRMGPKTVKSWANTFKLQLIWSWQGFGLQALGITTFTGSSAAWHFNMFTDKTSLNVGWYRWEVHRLYRNDSSIRLVAVAGLLKKEALIICLCVLEEYGQPVQQSQYLSRHYEIHPFTIVRQWRRCSKGAADEHSAALSEMGGYHGCLKISTTICIRSRKSVWV